MVPVLEHIDWLSGRVPQAVRARIRDLVELVQLLPHRQPLAIVTGDGVVLAANRTLFDLLGDRERDLLESDWVDVMPGWEIRGRRLCEDGLLTTRTFEEYVVTADGRRLWTHVVVSPIWGGGALAAWALFVTDRTPGAAA